LAKYKTKQAKKSQFSKANLPLSRIEFIL